MGTTPKRRYMKQIMAPRVLFVCHGNDDDCGEMGDPYKSVIPVTKNLLLACTTLDIDRKRHPDAVGNIGDTSLKLPHSSYDIILHLRCPCCAYMERDGGARQSAVSNILRYLKPGGVFVFDLSLQAARLHNERHKVVRKFENIKRLTSRHRSVFERIHTVGAHFAAGMHRSLDVVSDDAELHRCFVKLGLNERHARDAVERVRDTRRIVLRKTMRKQ